MPPNPEQIPSERIPSDEGANTQKPQVANRFIVVTMQNG